MVRDTRVSRARWAEDHDGDTTRLFVDQLFDLTGRHWIRLDGVKAPELKQLGGPSTAQFVAKWMKAANLAVLGRWPLELTTWRTSGDEDVRTLARYVGIVKRVDNGQTLNDAVNAFLALHPDWPQGIGGDTDG